MVANKVARRYAKSLMLLAQERNELEKAIDGHAVNSESDWRKP